ncbi:MAG: hypothetical protein ICV84_00065, partial [Flavisolibacter sp.]|nr:hypothetical protein [Flavisolibacter sp.]
VSHDIDDLILMSHHEVNEIIVRKMKEIVPEFISNNSEYEKLDKVKISKTISDTEKAIKIAVT